MFLCSRAHFKIERLRNRHFFFVAIDKLQTTSVTGSIKNGILFISCTPVWTVLYLFFLSCVLLEKDKNCSSFFYCCMERNTTVRQYMRNKQENEKTEKCETLQKLKSKVCQRKFVSNLGKVNAIARKIKNLLSLLKQMNILQSIDS